MVANRRENSATRQAAWEAEMADREAARERVRNSWSPTWDDLRRATSPVSSLQSGEGVENLSPPVSGRASVDSVALHNARARAELHFTQSLERIEQLEGELGAARRQVQALQWSRDLHTNRMQELEELHEQHERNLTRMVREMRRVHEVLPMALEVHRTKVRALHPEEEEELLLHSLQKGNVVETFIEIINHGQGMVRVNTDRDEFFFAPMRSGMKKRFNVFRPDKKWRADHPWLKVSMGAVRIVNYGRTKPLPEGFAEFLKRNLAGIKEVSLDNMHSDSLKELCKARGKVYSYSERLY